MDPNKYQLTAYARDPWATDVDPYTEGPITRYPKWSLNASEMYRAQGMGDMVKDLTDTMVSLYWKMLNEVAVKALGREPVESDAGRFTVLRGTASGSFVSGQAFYETILFDGKSIGSVSAYWESDNHLRFKFNPA